MTTGARAICFLLLMRNMRIDAHLMRIDAHQQKLAHGQP